MSVTGYDGAVTERVGDGVVPGTPDELTEQQRTPDPVRPRESDSEDADLRERMERLPPNHPSSPYNEDGSRKPPAHDPFQNDSPIPGDPDYPPDISKSPDGDQPTSSTPDGLQEGFAEAPDSIHYLPTSKDATQSHDVAKDVHPLTDEEYVEHVRDARQRLEYAQSVGLATYQEHTLDGRGEVWLKQRDVHHVAIVNELYGRAVNVPAEHQAIIAGGLPGAGKTTVLENHAGIDRSKFLIIDPDEIKNEMAQRGLTPYVEGLSPMETSDLIHVESSHIAKRLANVAQAEGKNVIWDITMSSRSSTEQRINELRSNGYTYIEAIFVHIPSEISKVRAEKRHRVGHDEYRAGKGEGGRLVPSELIDRCNDPAWGSTSRRTFEEVKHSFDRWSVYDNSVDGLSPVLTHSSETEERQP